MKSLWALTAFAYVLGVVISLAVPVALIYVIIHFLLKVW